MSVALRVKVLQIESECSRFKPNQALSCYLAASQPTLSHYQKGIPTTCRQKEKEGVRENNMYIYVHMFPVCICCFVLCYLPKLKWVMALAFGADFLFMFSIKTFLPKYHISWLSSCIRPNFLTKISNKVCFQIPFQPIDEVINFTIQFYHLLQHWPTKVKRGEGIMLRIMLISMFDFQFI